MHAELSEHDEGAVSIDGFRSGVRVGVSRQKDLRNEFVGSDQLSARERGYRSVVWEWQWVTVPAAEVVMFGEHFGRSGPDCSLRRCDRHMLAWVSYLPLH